MLRAISEMAVAMIVRSLPEKPTAIASSRPFWRAVTTSPSRSTAIRVSSSGTVATWREERGEQVEPLLEVQRRCHVLERQAQLDHRESDAGLDADDDRLGAAQSRGLGDAAQRARGERIHHVERRDVDD